MSGPAHVSVLLREVLSFLGPQAGGRYLDATFGGANNPDYANLIFASDYHTDIQEPAAFGEMSFQPWDPLKITAGLRWYQVKDTAHGYQEGLATGGGPAIVDPPVTTTDRQAAEVVPPPAHLRC